MTTNAKQESREREQTDESLRSERDKADVAMADRQDAVQEDADGIVERARENADDVLIAARNKADARLSHAPTLVGTHSAIVESRRLEDEALLRERAAADESLRCERRAYARALKELLPSERDETDRRLLTERARSDEAVSHRDDFLGMVSHDLRNLLEGVVMSAALLAARAPENEDKKQTLTETDRIARYAASMNRLIGDLIDVASIDAGKLALVTRTDDATALIAEVSDTLAASASAKGVSVVNEVGERPLSAEYDHDRMLQVLTNLVVNSIKFTPRNGTIRLRIERAADQLRFSVTDTGCGIPGDMLEAIFERFWQVGHNNRRGLGLGLYISKCIVEAHGGRIWAESEPGEGCKVTLTLPVAPTRPLNTPLRA
jgi:signal transduction histidine kinase